MSVLKFLIIRTKKSNMQKAFFISQKAKYFFLKERLYYDVVMWVKSEILY